MKRILSSLVLSFFYLTTLAQQTEFSFGAYRTLMHFSGSGSAGTTSVSSTPFNRLANPYGTKNGSSFGFFIQVQVINKHNFIAGLQAGTDQLRSKIQVTRYTTSASWDTYYANGIVNQDNQYINANPYVGYRFTFGKMSLDALVGAEAGFQLVSNIEGFVKNENGQQYKVEYRFDNLKTDIRAKAGFAVHYDRISLNASYAHGFTDHGDGTSVAGPRGAYTNVFRFGVGFKVF
ncbi:hypothetical protein FPZ42_00540 [Mucilaginibacter achroorhodeus]|uniref:Outer membrane protein beta-barrel domain-containing protein n=1 Tax=Mucilaginibacter achroorhodeus TaxID=2599294 RepID=A0A563U8S9_9SPHI|nr:hypothetical protein [Mucilaginibacter achroorhodeus]TWR27734.1 hypothetical protein FPZ42_00540 [Mucilaginibacter achroorhodeus]